MSSESNKAIVDELIKNNISLEKATLHLIDSITTMTERMDRILSLFENAAQNIEKLELTEPLSKQLEGLLEQNKSIARGLILIEKYIREKGTIGFGQESFNPQPIPKSL